MPNLPFRIAFWALAVALTLTVAAAFSKPEQVRFARKAPPAPPAPASAPARTAPQRSLAGRQPQSRPGYQIALPETAPLDTPTPAPRDPEAIASPLPPVEAPEIRTVWGAESSTARDDSLAPPRMQIASTDPVPVLGVSPPPTPHHADGEAAPAASAPEEGSLTIPVPVPDSLARLEGKAVALLRSAGPDPSAEGIQKLQQDLLRFQLEQAREELEQARRLSEKQKAAWLQEELDDLRSGITQVRLAQKHRDAPGAAGGDRAGSTGELLTAAPGETTGTWTFRFVAAPVPGVLRFLGEHAGWSVVVLPEVQGEFTGEFPNADPEQALALVVKAHGCSVTRRGNALLIGRR